MNKITFEDLSAMIIWYEKNLKRIEVLEANAEESYIVFKERNDR